MRIIAKIRVLFLVFAIIFLGFGLMCIAGKGSIEKMRDDAKAKPAAEVEYLNEKMSYDDFLEKSEKDMDAVGEVCKFSMCLFGFNAVIFILGQVKASKQKKEKAQERE